MICQGGVCLFFVSPRIESFGFVEDDEVVDIGFLFALLVLLPSPFRSRLLLVLRCFPGLFGFVVFFFLFVDFIMRVFFPCIPPFAMSSVVLNRVTGIVVMDEYGEHFIGLYSTLSVNA